MTRDYCITWGYIVRKMSELFNIGPNSDEKYSMKEIETRIDRIWNEFFDMVYTINGEALDDNH